MRSTSSCRNWRSRPRRTCPSSRTVGSVASAWRRTRRAGVTGSGSSSRESTASGTMSRSSAGARRRRSTRRCASRSHGNSPRCHRSAAPSVAHRADRSFAGVFDMLICRLASSLALEGCPLVPWDDAEGAPDPGRARVSYVDDMRRELELLVKHHRDVPLPPEEVPEFRTFRCAETAKDMIAVDGSYSFLLNLSSWWLALISVGLLRYGFDGTAFRRKDWRLVQRMVGVSTFAEFVATQDELHRSLFEFTKERREEQPRDMVNEYRRLIEGQTAINFADDLEDCIVAVDGTLSEFPKQFSVMERLLQVCEKRGHLLVGISKDSQLHAFGHTLTDEELMARCQGRLPHDALAYARAPKAAEAMKEGLLYGDIYYARLHPRARKWFRVDLGTFRDRPDEAFGQLASYGKSLVSVGYPWPLIEAHRMAVTVRQLKPVYQESVMKMALRMGLDVRTILDGLTQVEGRKRSAFHEYLDKVARDLR